MTPSRRQLAVYSTFENTSSNILIQAVAGGAKTTTLMGIVERAIYRCLIVAFNKSIQEEFSARIQAAGFEHAKAVTLHSLGLSAVRHAYRNVVISKNKNYEIIKALQTYNRRLFHNMQWEEKIKTTLTLMEMNDVSRIYLTEVPTEIFVHMASMDKYFYQHEQIEDLWREFLYIRESQTFGDKTVIDYLDMIYLPVVKNLFIPIQPYYLMIDEAQDLNLVQHKMIDNLINQGDVNKWVAVGDRHQSIYGFSGSYASSFDLFRTKGDVIELPLDVCYRCPQAVINQANAVYNVMEGYKNYEGKVGIVDSIEDIQDGSMVICRNTNPLVDVYFRLLGLNKKVYIKGEDIIGSITNFLKPYAYKTVRDASRKINSELIHLTELENKTDEQRYKLYKLKQNYSNFNLLAVHYARPTDKVEVIIQSLQRMFEVIPDAEAITLCTIHKAKGLEADVVYILNENLIPSKFAKSATQLEQEKNLKYVARTRAKEELYYLNLDI